MKKQANNNILTHQQQTRPKHLQFGEEAEQTACDFLISKGMQVVDRNYSCYVGEIDLIMKDQDDIVFVEVRGRHRTDYGNALESITSSKMNKLIRAATCFLQWKKWLYKVNSRFDIIAIHPQSGKLEIDWVKNAFTVDR